MPHLFSITLLTSSALAVACALLSVIVVLRRWAFIGEGISHSGLGGAGTAWLLMLAFPVLDQPWVPYASVIVFCIATAVAMGAISRGGSIQADAAIGIFLVASLAWGFLAREIYLARRFSEPPFFDVALFGRLVPFSSSYTWAALGICVAVLIIIFGLWKEIVAYTFDPQLALTSGIRAGMIHYLLMMLIALVIVIGMRMAGSVLVTALLVLPGATALLISRKLKIVIALSIVVAMMGTLGGLTLSMSYHHLPSGPCMVLIMFIEFVLAYAASKWPRAAAVS